jgi:cytoskeletal protein RodZ
MIAAHGNNPALLLPSSYDHSIQKTTTQNKNKDRSKNKNRRNSSSYLLQFKVILTLVLIFGFAVLSTFIQVIPLIIGNPRQLSTHTILKTTTTATATATATATMRTAATATSTNNNIPIINDEPDGTTAQYDIDINGNSHDSNNRNNPISIVSPIQNKTKTKFDPTQITTVYHLGHQKKYG